MPRNWSGDPGAPSGVPGDAAGARNGPCRRSQVHCAAVRRFQAEVIDAVASSVVSTSPAMKPKLVRAAGIAVTQLGVLGSSRRLLYNCHLEAVFYELAHVGLDAEIGRHARPHHFPYSALAELEREVVAIRSVDLVGIRRRLRLAPRCLPPG